MDYTSVPDPHGPGVCRNPDGPDIVTDTATRRRPRILVADDTDTIRALFEKLLTGEGYQVVSAEDGLEALDAVSVHHPDVDPARRRHARHGRHRSVPQAQKRIRRLA